VESAQAPFVTGMRDSLICMKLARIGLAPRVITTLVFLMFFNWKLNGPPVSHWAGVEPVMAQFSTGVALAGSWLAAIW
jgi:hypothetical protein